jgi:hypothetical protein
MRLVNEGGCGKLLGTLPATGPPSGDQPALTWPV